MSKNGVYSINLYTSNQCTQFQANIFLAVQWPRNQVKVMTSLILIAFFVTVKWGNFERFLASTLNNFPY